MMWALEYDPDLYMVYEEPGSSSEGAEGSKGKLKSIRHYGKYEREILKSGAKADDPLPISVFLVVSVLKEKGPQLLKEARGLDDVVKVRLLFLPRVPQCSLTILLIIIFSYFSDFERYSWRSRCQESLHQRNEAT